MIEGWITARQTLPDPAPAPSTRLVPITGQETELWGDLTIGYLEESEIPRTDTQFLGSNESDMIPR